MKRIIKFLFLVLLMFGFSSVSVGASSNPQRIFGNDRVKTSIEISKKAYTSSKTVILVGYNGQVDGLGGTILAHAKNAPMLYTGRDKNKVDDLVLREIERLKAEEIYILGGETVVSKEIENSLSHYKVTRIKGLRREDTAINIAKKVKGENIPEVFLTIGYGDYADALAIGPVSGRQGIPIFLTKSNALPKDTKEALKNLGVGKVTLIGGKSVISTDVENELKTMGIQFKRVFGNDRVQTAINIANTYMGNPSGVVIANGWEFADAVVGGYLAAKENAPILLSKDKVIDIKNLDYIANNKIQTYILGGDSVINKGIFEDIGFILNGNIVIEPIQIERLFIEGTSVAGTEHIIKAEVISSKKVLYRFYEKDLSTNSQTVIQDYSEKNTAIWIPKKKGDYWYGVDIKESTSQKDKDISKYVPIEIKPSIPAQLHSLDITGTNEAKTPHKIVANGSGVNGVLYRFYIKDEDTGNWTMIQDYSEKNTVTWIPEKTGKYLYSVNVKDKNSWEDKEAQKSIGINIIPLKPATIESLEIKGSKYENTDHTLIAKGSSTNGVLYKFYIKDESTGNLIVVQDYSEKNTAIWRPGKIGNYSYYVAVKDKRSDNDRDNLLFYPITINPRIYYNVSNYQDTFESALDKQVGIDKNTTYKNGWVQATKDEIKDYLNPDRFLQFKPEEDMSLGSKEGTVITNTLNVRIGPNTSYGIIGQTTKGSVHKLISENNGWYMIDLDGINGWISGAYLSIVENKYIISLQITTSVLNVRQNPDTISPILTKVTNGSVYVALEDKNGWYKINADGKIGWISGSYVNLINDVPREMYQFMVLSGQCGVSVNEMNRELKGIGILEDKGAAFIEGSKKYNVNELYLMAHAFLETGKGTSSLANGILVNTVDGKPVEPKVVYNMYGIGAVDSNALKGGSETAYKLGWFTPEIAITEGAHWISNNYINNQTYKQDTLYKMKWNPARPGTHQYATDIGWAIKQTRQIDIMMELCRKMEGVILRFDIPKYR